MKTIILRAFLTILTLTCFLHPTISYSEDYLFERLWPSEILGLRYLSGVAVDSSGNVYVVDADTNRMIKYNSSGSVLLTIGSWGIGNGQFNDPNGVAVDSLGNVYVTDTGNHRIQEFDSNGTYITKWGTGGSGNGQFREPRGVAVDSSGNVYVADTSNNRIQEFDSNGTYITQWGTYGSGNGQFYYPNGVAVDSLGNVYVADESNSRIQKFDSNGTYITKWGTYGDGNGQFKMPNGVAVDSSGNVYVADNLNNLIQKFNSNGTYITQWRTSCCGVAVDSLGNVYVTDEWSCHIYKFNSNGNYITQWGTRGTGNGQFDFPSGVAVDSLGNVYVADRINHRIQKFDPDGTYITKWGNKGDGNGQFNYPYGVAVDSLGNVFVADTDNHRIQKFDSNGTYITKWGTPGSGNGQFDFPHGVAVNSLGNVYVADLFNCRIQKFDSNGTYITKWGTPGSGNGQFDFPHGVAVDSLGNVYVADTDNNRIQKFYPNGAYITKWGTYGTGNGQFLEPNGVAVSILGKIYVADTNNHRIQEFSLGFNVTSPTSSAPAGSNVAFSVDIFISNITTGTLYYKKGGEASYGSVNLTFQSGNAWTTTIPAVDVTTSGIAYYIDALDDSDVHYYYGSADSPKNISVHGSSSISTKTTPAGSGNVWNIVGPSVITDDKSIMTSFGAGFGTTWIAWRWDPDENRWEAPQTFKGNPVTSDPFDAGTSWFYAVDGDGSNITKNIIGTTANVNVPFMVPLRIGWNLICNPFDFGVAWSDSAIKIKYGTWEGTPTEAEALNYVDNRAIWYNPDTKANVTRFSNEATPYVMPKTRGQWLYSAVYGAYVMFYPTASSPAPPSIQKEDKGLWRIDLILRSSNGTDNVQAIADREAKDISLNEMKPPSLPMSVSRISFIRDMTELSSDRQKQSGDIEWSVSIDAPDESSLEWNLTGVRDEYKLTLEDMETGRQFDLRQEKNIPIAKGEKGHRYILRAKGIAVPKATRLLVNYPNPFNPETWIPYELSEGSEVFIKIYATTGQLVRTLNLGIREAGYYTTQEKAAHWDGKNEAGEHVSSGVYFYNIQAGNYHSTMKMIVTK